MKTSITKLTFSSLLLIIMLGAVACAPPLPGGGPPPPPRGQTAAGSENAQSPIDSDAGSTCLGDEFIRVQAHSANSAYTAPQLSVTCSSDTITIRSNGIPNFEFIQTTPNELRAQNYSWNIPRIPQEATQPIL